MRILPTLPISPSNSWLTNTTLSNTKSGLISSINNKKYCTLSMIIYLTQTINSQNKFKEKFYAILKKYPNVDPVAMGFTPNWKNEPIWKVNNWINKIISSVKGFF